MQSSRTARLVAACLSIVAMLALEPAAAQGAARQTLDRVDAYTAKSVLEMLFGTPARPPDFRDTGITGNALATCTLTATRGLYCLDGDAVRRWPSPGNPASELAPFSCRAALSAAPRKGEACSGLTVDVDGVIWIAGQRNNAHSVLKLVDGGGSCPAGTRAVPGSTYCASDFYTGRPPLLDLVPVDGANAARFRTCTGCAPQAGVLGLEARKDVIFFPDPKAASGPVTLVSGKSWGLRGKEDLQGVALLQIPDGDSAINFIVVTTSAGRVLARNTAGGNTQQVFDIPSERDQPASAPNKPCFASTGAPGRGNEDRNVGTATNQYGLRASTISGTVYVSDRNFCEVLALRPQLTATTNPAQPLLRLVNLSNPDGSDLTLSTDSTLHAGTPTVGTFPPLGVTVAEGVAVRLDQCATESCPVVSSATAGKPAAAISAVKLQEGSPSGVTLFQVVGIPDCRYRNKPGFDPALKATCESLLDQVIVRTTNGPNAEHPATQMLNVKPLLPESIRSQFRGEIPPAGKPLLISRQYRGQPDRQYVFDAFFAIAEPGVRFNGSFLFAFDVPLLDDPRGVPEVGRRCQPSDGGRSLQDWDVMTRVSETYPSVDGLHVDAITNVDCINPSMSEEVSFSLLPYTLEITPDTYDARHDRVTEQNDAVFARLVQKLYADLEAIRTGYVCPAAPAALLLPAATCDALRTAWAIGKYKLDVCIAQAFEYPDDHNLGDQNVGDQNVVDRNARVHTCRRVLPRLDAYVAILPTDTPVADTANRTGELRARVNSLRHVFETRFLPSIPDKGFCREKRPGKPYCNPQPWPTGVATP